MGFGRDRLLLRLRAGCPSSCRPSRRHRRTVMGRLAREGGLNLEGVLLFGVIKGMITKVGWGGGWLERLTSTVLIPALTASVKFGR